VTKVLDLHDIQGNIVRAYGRFGFPVARYIFLQIRDGDKGRAFVGAVTNKVTSAATWGVGPHPIPKPKVTTNIAFTYGGLKALGVPRESLRGFPPEFVMGMKKRKDILGDDGPSAPENWDSVWHQEVHVFVSFNGQSQEFIEQQCQWLLQLIDQSDGGVVLLRGHRGDDGSTDLPYQDAKIVFENGKPTSKEHFGYTDGIGDPVFEGLPDSVLNANGRGKPTADGGWEPLATGEFILGHFDEAHEYPPAPKPFLLSRNSTFMVYRKLHQNVGTFNAYLEEQGKLYPGGKELLAAKFVGRWRDNGAPLVSAPDVERKKIWDAKFAQATSQERDNMLSSWDYDKDPNGAKCPFSSHIRRINPRSSLEFGNKGAFDTPGALSNRRRIIRRGLPYGEVKDPDRDDGNHGIIIMMINADINRQFEFVQQQWINYGNDFKASNDRDIILGNHSKEFPSKAVLPVEPDSDQVPFFLKAIPRLVETRGGDYFFVPSITALCIIAEGTIDPT